MLPGETIRTGAPATCPSCGETPEFEALNSGAGWYVGTRCACGPYTRESHYYGSSGALRAAMVHGVVRWRDDDGAA